MDAGVGEGVVDGLGGFGGDGDDADVDVVARARPRRARSQARTGMPLREVRPILAGSLSSDGDDVEAVAVEAAVVGQGHAEVAGADDDDVAGAVDAERLRRVGSCRRETS